jgi:hypothetical protein
MTIVEHNGKAVLILSCYPWRVELSPSELLALAALAPDADACLAASVLAAADHRAGMLKAVAAHPTDQRLRLVDQCAAVADRLSPAGWPNEPSMLPRDCAGTAC